MTDRIEDGWLTLPHSTTLHLVCEDDGHVYYVDGEGNKTEFHLLDFLSEHQCHVSSDPIEYENYENPIGKNKQDVLDRKYPHTCHKCHRQLHFKELFDRNISEVLKYYFENTSKCKTKWDFRGCYNREYKMYKHLKRLWKSKVVQFYCCYCYDSRKVQKIHFAP